ncbi:MAG: PaaX family transcriptional regulator C-terminal domain-containing protein [Candidatus Binataceae bacterium]
MAGIANASYEPERPLTARAIVLDFLSNRAPREISARAVLAAGAVFGFSEQNLRMALTRLSAQGVAVNSGRGRYRLGASGETMRVEVRKWKRVADLVRPWSGAWAGVYGANIARSDRAAIRRHEQALRLRGFREFGSGLWIRPANLRDSIAELRVHLQGLGLHREAIVFGLGDFDDATGKRAAGLWDIAAIQRAYHALRDALQASTARVERLPLKAAAAETLLLGRDVIRHINLDPLLPEELMPRRHLRELVRAMTGYDEIGRGIWRRFMREIESRD